MNHFQVKDKTTLEVRPIIEIATIRFVGSQIEKRNLAIPRPRTGKMLIGLSAGLSLIIKIMLAPLWSTESTSLPVCSFRDPPGTSTSCSHIASLFAPVEL